MKKIIFVRGKGSGVSCRVMDKLTTISIFFFNELSNTLPNQLYQICTYMQHSHIIN